MRRSMWTMGLLGTLALGSCGTTSTPTTQYDVTGTVSQGRAQSAVSGVSVGTGAVSGTTDADGTFSVKMTADQKDLLFSKSGFASTLIQNLDATQAQNLDVILRPAFDPSLPATPPTVTVDLIDGATVGGDDLTVKLNVTVAAPDRNAMFSGIASIGNAAGTSGYLNAGRVRRTFGNPRTTEQSVTFSKADFAAFKGKVDIHFVVYDVNGNRTDVIRHVNVESEANASAISAPKNVEPFAVTFADDATFGAMSTSPEAVNALRAGKLPRAEALKAATSVNTLLPQAAPAGHSLWVDVDFNADGAAPRAFELWRSLDGTAFTRVLTASPASVLLDEDTGLYRMRDTGAALKAGQKVYYRVRAVSDAGTADSDVQDVTPLGAFSVALTSPVQGTTGVDRAPVFRWTTTGAAAQSRYYVVVQDRTQADSLTLAWLSAQLKDQTQAIYNADGRAALARLQPYHAYDWQLAALTLSADGRAVSLAADFLNLFQLSPSASAAARSGPVNEFVTGGL